MEWTPKTLNEIVQRYKSGESCAVIAQAIGSNYWTVSRRLKAAGVELRPSVVKCPIIRPISDTRRCSACQCTYPLEQFVKNKSQPGGRAYECVECAASSKIKRELARLYGLTVTEYEAMRLAQGGKCLICDRPELISARWGTPVRLGVDHCHSTGVIRGLLCYDCNVAIARLGDDPTRIRKCAEYLEAPRESPRYVPVKKAYRHPCAKLDHDSVRKIKARLAKGESCHSIAKSFDISSASISGIKRGQSYRNVT